MQMASQNKGTPEEQKEERPILETSNSGQRVRLPADCSLLRNRQPPKGTAQETQSSLCVSESQCMTEELEATREQSF